MIARCLQKGFVCYALLTPAGFIHNKKDSGVIMHQMFVATKHPYLQVKIISFGRGICFAFM